MLGCCNAGTTFCMQNGKRSLVCLTPSRNTFVLAGFVIKSSGLA